MANVQITVDKTRYTLSCADGQEDNLLRLTKVLNEKVAQVRAGGYVPENLALVMAGLLLANEAGEAEQKAASLESQAEKQPETVDSFDAGTIKDIEKITERVSALARRFENA